MPPTTAVAPHAHDGRPLTAYMPDITFSVWNIALLCLLLLFLILCGMFMSDLLMNMWSWNGAFTVNSSLMDTILSWFEK